jgi:hypothetical protein
MKKTKAKKSRATVPLSWQGEGTVVEQLYQSSEGEIVVEQFHHQFRHQGH